MINTHPLPHLSIVVAQADNRAIGLHGDMPWHLSADLKRFKALTMGHPVVMGRRTWESLPKRPLPGRRNIVLTQNDSFKAEGAEVAHSINDIFTMLHGEDEAFVIGGGQLYALLMPWVEKLYVTWVHRSYAEADTYFPVIDNSTFALTSQSPRQLDQQSGLEYSFAEYTRKYGR